MRLRSWGSVVVALLAAACGGDGGPEVLTLSRFAGDSQEIALSDTSELLTVRLTNSLGHGEPGIPVTFAVTSGSGSLTPLVDTTDADGAASTVFTGAATPGRRSIGATAGDLGVDFQLLVGPGLPALLLSVGGDEQAAAANASLAQPLSARVADGFERGVAGAVVRWAILGSGGSVSADSTISDGAGLVQVTRVLGAGAGGQEVAATVIGADTLRFHATARKGMTVLAGGDNVPGRCSSDLWVSGNYGYSGTWGNCGGHGARYLNIWDVSAGVIRTDSIAVGQGTLSDNEVSGDGTLLLATSEGGGSANGLYIYSLTDPAHPALLGFEQVTTGLHTGTFADLGGERYVFAAKDPSAPALMVFRIQPDSADKIVQVASLAQPSNYGIHDQLVRDGIALVADWDNGLRIYDVGNGIRGGSPAAPALVDTIVTARNGLSCACVHNVWWYHDTTGSARYVFVGQEGPTDFSTASGDIHVVDVSDLTAPKEVAFYHLANAGTHNFWMDETRGILYAAYYNGGVVALDVTGRLSGDLASREIARITPGGPGDTFTWGVMLANGALYTSDMFSGFWKLSVP